MRKEKTGYDNYLQLTVRIEGRKHCQTEGASGSPPFDVFACRRAFYFAMLQIILEDKGRSEANVAATTN
jgi:hypothetical protein